MGVYRRANKGKKGKIYWFKFKFNGQLIRQSAQTTSKTVAREAERARRRELELAVNQIPKRERTPLFKAAAPQWLESKKPSLAQKSVAAYEQYVASLTAEFGNRLVCDINRDDIARLQSKRQREGKSGRTINYEIHTLRMILKHFNLWWPMADVVKMVRERQNVGKALSHEEETRLIDAAARSGSPVLLPLIVLSLDTGLRAAEVRALRRKDLKAVFKDNHIIEGEVFVPTSKTEAGTGRTVPLTLRACKAMTLWFAQIPETGPEAYLFPRHQVGFDGNTRRLKICKLCFDEPIGEWKTAWRRALKHANVKARWHDLRHTLISRLAENPNVSEETIRAIAGHVAPAMLRRYSHIRASAKREAIKSLENDRFGREGAQIEAHCESDELARREAESRKSLN